MPSLHRMIFRLLPLLFLLSSCLTDSDGDSGPNTPPTPRVPRIDTSGSMRLPVTFRFDTIHFAFSDTLAFRFSGHAGQSIRIEVPDLGGAGRPASLSLWLFDTDARTVIQSKSLSRDHDGHVAIHATCPSDGDFHVVFITGPSIESWLQDYPLHAPIRIVPLDGGVPVDSFENDDRLSQATLVPSFLTGRSVWQARTIAASDPDWIRFHVDSGWSYWLYTGSPNEAHNKGSLGIISGIDLFDSDSQAIAWDYVASGSWHRAYYSDRSRTIFARISGAPAQGDPEAYGAGEYALQFDIGRILDSNDTKYVAHPAPPDSVWHRAGIETMPGYNQDFDWYQLPADSGRIYVFEVVSDSTDLNVEFSRQPLPPASYATERVDAQTTGPTDTARFALLSSLAGNYPMCVQALDPEARGTYRYRIRTVDATDSLDAYELNDRSPEPRPIATDGAVQQRSIWVGDVDLIPFQADSGKIYAIEIEGADAWVRSMRLLDERDDDAHAPHGYVPGTRRVEFVCSQSGRYTIQFFIHPSDSGADTLGSAPAHYSVAVRAIPRTESSLDAFEPDDTRDDAKPILPDGSVQRRTLLGGDIDLILLDLASDFSSCEVEIKALHPIQVWTEQAFGGEGFLWSTESGGATWRGVSHGTENGAYLAIRSNPMLGSIGWNEYTISIKPIPPQP